MNEIILDRVFAEPIVVKTISAAWNKIREIRNTTPAEELNGQILTVTMPENLKTGRIPRSDSVPYEQERQDRVQGLRQGG